MKKIRAKKNLGQHFLDDLQIAQQISDLIKSDNNPNILEVGPGTGALTQYLVKKTNNIKCVEIDHDCILLLKKQFYEISNNIIEGDFLKLNLQKIFRNPYIIIGNFPYNISTQILFHILEYKDLVHQIIGMCYYHWCSPYTLGQSLVSECWEYCQRLFFRLYSKQPLL